MDHSNMVARLVISEGFQKTVGIGIEHTQTTFEDREETCGIPLSLKVAERFAGSVLGPLKPHVRAFSSSGSLLGEWIFNAEKQVEQARTNACKRSKEKPAEDVSAEQSAAIKAEKKVKAKLRTAEKEREQLAKAPKGLLPIQGHLASKAMAGGGMAKGQNHRLPYADRGLAPVPFLASDSKISVSLFRQDGTSVSFPIHKGLYTSAVSRGKSKAKDDPTFDPDTYVKRLLGELLLGEKAGNREHQGAMRQGKVKGHAPEVRYIRALVSGSNNPIAVTRTEALEVQADPKRDEYKRKVGQVMSRKMQPFGGAKSLKWQPSLKDSRASFSHG